MNKDVGKLVVRAAAGAVLLGLVGWFSLGLEARHLPGDDKITVPTFLSRYVGQGNTRRLTSPDQSDMDRLADLIADRVIRRLEERGAIDGPEGQPGQPGQPARDSVEAVLSGQCAGCHTGAKARGGFALFSGPGLLQKDVDRWLVYDRVSHEDPSQVMPPAPKAPLSPEQTAKVREWARQARR